MRQMTRTQYREKLLPEIERFMLANEERHLAAREIVQLMPGIGYELLRNLETPPFLCEDCAAPCVGALCQGCRAKRDEADLQRLVEARARELADEAKAP